MADSWEDEADDWEAEADKLVSGINLNEVDESRFEGEQTSAAPESWEEAVPKGQVSNAAHACSVPLVSALQCYEVSQAKSKHCSVTRAVPAGLMCTFDASTIHVRLLRCQQCLAANVSSALGYLQPKKVVESRYALRDAKDAAAAAAAANIDPNDKAAVARAQVRNFFFLNLLSFWLMN